MREDIQYEILDYLSRYPNARDSAEGIMTWWLSRDTEVTLPEVEEALSELVRLRWINRAGEGKAQSYGLENTAMKEIRTYLAKERKRG